jgi:acyl-CoA dehydrogenase
MHGGADTLGIRASWDKRYITLAPDATLIGVALHLFDPENLLGNGEDRGITVAMVPATHPGVQIGRRHLPSGAAFPNGPTSGKDVFIPMDWVIGGETMVGHGWPMLMECVATSRAIALPSCAVAAAKVALRVSTAYSRVRRQFGSPIGQMEGVEEPLARIVETAYVGEAGRAVTAAMVSRRDGSSAVAALMKYQMTERARGAINDAMAVQGGRAVFDGPANCLQSMYQLVPTVINADGTNIVMRALIAFTQGALRAHPYLPAAFDACADEDARRGLLAFEEPFLSHIAFALSNLASAFLHNVTGGRFCRAPDKSLDSARWFRQLSRASRNFALVADLTLVTLGRQIRTRQKLTGRLADALSELFLLACALTRYEADGRPGDDQHLVVFAMQKRAAPFPGGRSPDDRELSDRLGAAADAGRGISARHAVPPGARLAWPSHRQACVAAGRDARPLDPVHLCVQGAERRGRPARDGLREGRAGGGDQRQGRPRGQTRLAAPPPRRRLDRRCGRQAHHHRT